MIAIKLENVSKQYEKKKVIDSLSFEIPENSICGFLGVNGAGKTTTLKLLSGLIDNNGGTIKIYDEEISTKKQSKYVRFLQDVPEFYNFMTAFEYLKFICELNNIKDKKEKIKEALELVGMEESKNKKIGGFSRGMKQRMGIAANIISEPKILLLDEPVSALDPMGRKEIFELIGKLKGRTTILFSTHIIDDVEKVCDRLIVIDKGKKIIEGSIHEIKSNYLTDIIEIEFLDINDMHTFITGFENNKLDVNEETLTVRVTTNDIKNVQEKIFEKLSQDKIGINKLELATPSLEEIFMEEVEKQ